MIDKNLQDIRDLRSGKIDFIEKLEKSELGVKIEDLGLTIEDLLMLVKTQEHFVVD